MPASTEPLLVQVASTGAALRFTGALVRAQVPGLWQRLPSLAGVQVLDLNAVTTIDSAGLALLAEVAAKVPGTARIAGSPSGLEALRSAYRLDAGLGFGHD